MFELKQNGAPAMSEGGKYRIMVSHPAAPAVGCFRRSLCAKETAKRPERESPNADGTTTHKD
jgi:hypothetical protein